jgi:hypothetical protein
LLATYVALHDIADVEGFVCATIERSGLRNQLDEGEREDLIAEGISILYNLSDKFEPHRAGYATAGRFSGFAAQFLPRRLGDAWHQSHPEHRRLAGEDGKRRWHYLPTPLSLNAVLEGNNGNGGNQGQREAFGNQEHRIRPADQVAAISPS